MKLGLITDIHEHVEYLRIALARFRDEQVDQIVLIGDVCEMGHRLDETCRLLAEADVIGVWGNHDYGLCVEPSAEIRATYSEAVINFMTSLQPRLVIEDCYFAHIEPWLNPEDLADLWWFEGSPTDESRRSRIFNAVPNRLMLMGHYHSWQLSLPDRFTEWSGQTPVDLCNDRAFIVVGALCHGRYALLDTDTSRLIPFNERPLEQSVESRS